MTNLNKLGLAMMMGVILALLIEVSKMESDVITAGFLIFYGFGVVLLFVEEKR
jgi:hypothetical protein